MTRLALIAGGIAAVMMLGGCAVPMPMPTPTPTPTPTETFVSTGDGVLRVGTLLPTSGDVSSIAAAMIAAVEIAVRDLNAAGGVLEQPVEVLHRDAGDASQQRLETAFADLVARGVDVVIGPTSSALIERLLPLAAEAGVAVISPAAPGPAVRSVEPPGLFFRSLPAYDQQAAAIVRALAVQGNESVALVTTGDALGRSFTETARAVLAQEGLRLVGIEQLDVATNVERLAFSITGGEPDAVILATGGSLAAQNQATLTALAARGVRGDQVWLTSLNLTDYSTTVAAGVLEGVSAVFDGAPASDEFIVRLRQSDPALRSFRFAPEAYDAVVLAALATVLADDDGGSSIARYLPQAAMQGEPCASFGECLAVLETEPAIDYVGLSGPLTLDDAGDVIDGALGFFRYTAENRPEPVGTLPIAGR